MHLKLRVDYIVYLSVIAFIIISGCVVSEQSGSKQSTAKNATTIIVPPADNLQQFSSDNADEIRVVNILRNSIQAGYNTYDFDLMVSGMSNDFKRIILNGNDNLSKSSFADFKSNFECWSKSGNKTNRLVGYTLDRVVHGFSDDRIILETKSVYRSKYFNTRYEEIFVFDKDKSSSWKLVEQYIVPLQKVQLGQQDVQIFITAKPKDTNKNIKNEIACHGPDSIVDEFRRKELNSGFRGNEIPRRVLFVFREAPQIGARIIIHHQFWRPWAQNLQPYVFEYNVDSYYPYFIIENITKAGGSGGTITYKIFMDGVELNTKKIRIY